MTGPRKERETLREEKQRLQERIAALEKSLAESRRPADDHWKSHEKFKSIFDHVKDTILIETVNGKIIDANRAACRMLGYSKEELLELTVGDIVPADIARKLPPEIRRTSVEEGRYIESEQLLKDGRRIPVEVSTTLVEIGGEKLVIAILRDISDRKRAEEWEKERGYRTLFEISPIGILLEDGAGKIISANPAACRIFGYQREELVGMNVRRLAPPDAAAEVNTNIARLLRGETLSHLVRNVRKDGAECFIELNETRVTLLNGQPGILVLLNDVSRRIAAEAALKKARDELEKRVGERTAELTESNELLRQEMAERRAAEKNLRDSEEKYRGLFNISPEGIMLFDLQGNVITGNDRICQLYGYSHEEMLKLSLKDIVPEELEGNFPRLVENLRKAGDLFFESLGKKRDGSVFPVELSAGLFLWKGSDSVQVLVRDITRRKQIEEALEASESRLRSIIESSADGILIIDQNGVVRFVNPATERLFDRKADEFIGEPLAIPLTGGETAELVIERPDRRQLQVEIRVSEIRWEGTAAYLASLRDVTARKELEKFKDDFIDTVAHEIRNPLAVMRLGIGQLWDGIPGPINADQHEILAITLREIERLSRLVNNLLDLSKIEAGRVTFRRELFDLNSLIADTESKFRRTIEEKGLHLAVAPPKGPLLLYADPDRLHQVLTNLVGNALKFTPAGGRIVIGAEARGSEIECSVADTGIGIAPQDRERVFAKFTQCSYPNEGDAQGSGLGLAIAKELVELHGGRIWVESEPGSGCRFAFRIPDHRSEESLAAFLDGLRGRTDGARSRIGLLGFRIENAAALKSEWGEEAFSSLARQLFQRTGVLIQEIARSMPHCWLLDHSRECAAVLPGETPEGLRKIHEIVLRRLRKLRFQRAGKALEFDLRSALVPPGEREADGHGLIAALRNGLARPEAGVPLSRSRGRILVADDEPAIVDLLASSLSRENVRIESAFDGEEALQAALRDPPDLLILDLGLPKISGYEVIQQLKKNTRTADIPLILISGGEVDQVRLKRRGTGQVPILLKKPFDYDQVREAVNQKLAIEDIQL